VESRYGASPCALSSKWHAKTNEDKQWAPRISDLDYHLHVQSINHVTALNSVCCHALIHELESSGFDHLQAGAFIYMEFSMLFDQSLSVYFIDWYIAVVQIFHMCEYNVAVCLDADLSHTGKWLDYLIYWLSAKKLASSHCAVFRVMMAESHCGPAQAGLLAMRNEVSHLSHSH